MEATHLAPRPYMKVFVWLAGLTLVEVILASVIGSQLARVFLLMGLAIGKAMLVAMYYMHLRYDKRVLALIAAFPFALAVLFTAALVPDIGIGR